MPYLQSAAKASRLFAQSGVSSWAPVRFRVQALACSGPWPDNLIIFQKFWFIPAAGDRKPLFLRKLVNDRSPSTVVNCLRSTGGGCIRPQRGLLSIAPVGVVVPCVILVANIFDKNGRILASMNMTKDLRRSVPILQGVFGNQWLWRH